MESHHSKVIVVSSLALLLFSSLLAEPTCASNFMQDFDIVWGNDHVKLLNNGEVMSLSLDKNSGSGFRSKNQYLFGKIDMQIKMVPGNSAGTVTSYYMKSEGAQWDEIDFEFLGNLSGDPYLIHTNVYTQGKGDREQQFYPWFDPTADYHTYSILWNPQTIIIITEFAGDILLVSMPYATSFSPYTEAVICFSVDGVPIREYRNLETRGVPFPKNQAMRLQSTLWNADDWATRGGLVKTDWSKAPFVASYRNFNAQACVVSPSGQSCGGPGRVPPPWFNQQLDGQSRQRMRWVRQKYMVYNYCTDAKRFPNGFPPECAIG